MSELETLLARGDVDAATALVARRLAGNPADGEALLARARLAMLNQDYRQAAEAIARAEAAGAREAPLWRAILAEATGDPGALALLEAACGSARRQEPFFVLGRALNQRKRFADALPHLEKAAALAPDQAPVHFQLAYSLMELGQTKRGVQHLEQTLRLNPRYVPAYLVLSRMLAGNGQAADARKLLEQGVRLLPEDADLRGELASLKN